MPMTKDQAAKYAERVVELFPGANAEQGIVLVKNFQRFDPDVVSVAITRHAETHNFLNVPDLIGACGEEARRKPDPAKVRQRQEEEQTRAYWAAVDALVADMTDEDLADLSAEILPTLPPFARALAEKSGPRKGKLLKSAIYERLRPRGAVA